MCKMGCGVNKYVEEVSNKRETAKSSRNGIKMNNKENDGVEGNSIYRPFDRPPTVGTGKTVRDITAATIVSV